MTPETTTLRDIITQINEKSVEIQTLDREIEKKQQLILQINDTICIKEEDLKDTDQRLIAIKAVLAGRESTVATLDEQKLTKEREIRLATEQLQNVLSNFSRETDTLNKVYTQNKNAKDAIIANLDLTISQKDTEFKDLCSMIQVMSETKEKDIKEAEDRKKELEAKKQEISNTQEHISSLVGLIDNTQAELRLAKQEVEMIKGNIDDARRELETLELFRIGQQSEIDDIFKQQSDLVKFKAILDSKEDYIKKKYEKAGVPYN